MKKTTATLLLISIILLLLSCILTSCCDKITDTKGPAPIPSISPNPEISPTMSPQIPIETKPIALSWGKKEWDKILIESVRSNIQTLSKASDLPVLFDRSDLKYSSLTEDQKVIVIAEILVQVMKHESDWKPDCYYVERTMGIDPITGRQVASEGLLQLSYQDQVNYKKYFDCGFDWEKDKLLKNNDPKKTIFDPAKNISCGVKILARQVEKYGAITISNGAYWSTLKVGGRYSKIDSIKAHLKGLKI